MLDIEAMAEKIAGALFVKMKEGFAKRDAQIADLEVSLKTLASNQTLIAPDITAEVQKAVAAIPPPINGKDGQNGKDGTGISVTDVEPLIAQEVAKQVSAIPIPKDGKDGNDGTNGKDGLTPDVGQIIADEVQKAVRAIPVPKDGKSVTIDDVRPLILSEVEKAVAEIPVPQNGFNGIDGEPGTNGKDGEPGQPGRDAIELEILNEIDQTRTYHRGTYAKHDNGLWRSFETTDGMKGWECVISGIASVDIENKNEREFTIKIANSDGTVTQNAFSLPVMIYRGGLVEGKEYLAGDVVTWAGHTWHCNLPTAEKPIEGGKAWTMCVRRGRDGKEGPQGTKGADGRNLIQAGLGAAR